MLSRPVAEARNFCFNFHKVTIVRITGVDDEIKVIHSVVINNRSVNGLFRNVEGKKD